MKRSYLFMLLSTISVTAFAEEDIKQWITDRNTIAIDDFKNEDPTALPNYPTTSTGNESYRGNVQKMANDASNQATTDEGAKLIYGVPNRPEFQDDGWYKDAQNVTANPSDYIDTVDSEYTDCEEVISEGDTYTEIQACTESRISTTATCTQGRLLEIDADYLYTCNKERDLTHSSCVVGRTIDVTQSHKYSCNIGELAYNKFCNTTLHITVNHPPTNSNGECRYSGMPSRNKTVMRDGAIKDGTWSVMYWGGKNVTNSPGFTVGKKMDWQYDSGSSMWPLFYSQICRAPCPKGTEFNESTGKCEAPEPIITEKWITTCR